MAYALISDTHLHNFSLFASGDSGKNSRLEIILDEIWRVAKFAHGNGIKTLVHGGDLFHVRGKLAPSVLNPTLDLFEAIASEIGLEVLMISGNHDLEGNESEELRSAASSLRSAGVTVFNEPTRHITVDGDVLYLTPWISKVADLKEALATIKSVPPNSDLILHAPVNGVIKGLPDHGLDPEYLSSLPFARVFSGHYHNHKNFDDKTYSIGALTHQNWGDIGSKAGFMFVREKGVTFHESNAPKFVEINGDMTEEAIKETVEGNYVRATIAIEDEVTLKGVRQEIMDMGAAGVVIHPLRKPKSSVTARATSIKAGASLEHSIGEFIGAKTYDDPSAVTTVCLEILNEVEATE